MARKLVGLVVVVSMLLGMAACKGGTTASQTTAPITLKWLFVKGSSGTSGIQDNPVMSEVKKKYGISIDLTTNADAEQIAAMAASKDLPDILNAWITEPGEGVGPVVKTWIQGEDMIDMEPYIAKHGRDIVKDTGKVEFGKEFLSNGTGKLYFLPQWGIGLKIAAPKTFDSSLGIGLFVRWDIYKQIGYPELTGDWMNILPILKQMQDAYPVTAEGKKVYGISPNFADWGIWNWTMYGEGLDNIFSEAGGFVDMNCATNEIKSQILTPDSTLWKTTDFYHKATQLGLMDPDSAMQKYDQAQDKMSQGRVLMSYCNWTVSGPNANFIKNGRPAMGYAEIKLPSNITEVCNFYRNPYTDRFAQGITVKCKAPERAMDLLNFFDSDAGMSLLYDGIEGTNWKVGSDKLPHLAPDTLQLLTKGTAEELQQQGINSYGGFGGRSPLSLDARFNCNFYYANNEDLSQQMANATDTEKDFCRHYGVAYPDQLWEKTLPDQNKIYDGQYMMMVDPTPQNIATIDDNINNYLLQALLKATKVKDDAAYAAAKAEIVQKCKDLGAEQSFSWHLAAYQAALAKQQAFYGKIRK